jgi:hypothetical protein
MELDPDRFYAAIERGVHKAFRDLITRDPQNFYEAIADGFLRAVDGVATTDVAAAPSAPTAPPFENEIDI